MSHGKKSISCQGWNWIWRMIRINIQQKFKIFFWSFGKLIIHFTSRRVNEQLAKFIGRSLLHENEQDLKGLCTKKFYWLKSCTLPPLSRGHRWKIWQITIKNRKLHFCEIFGLSKLLTGQENGSQKGITGREFVSQISLPDGNLSLKYHYRTEIWLSNIITGREFGSQKSLPDGNCPVMIFERQIPVR